MVPSTRPGGNPVTAEPGETPRSPVTTEEPVFVTVEPPSTAKLFVVPSGGALANWVFVWVCPVTGSGVESEHEATTARRTKCGSFERIMVP
jgi:hypothetical protein